MKKNIGSLDKVIRILIAVGFALLFFTHVVTGTFGIILLVLAAILLITSFISLCPLYLLFGINTCPTKK